jgi:hypothetical protein
MRTDLRGRSALSLAAALLALGAATLAAQDGMTHLDDQVVVNRSLTVARNEVVDGRAVVMRGSLHVQGQVHGPVTVAGGSLVIDPGATVDGDVHVTGGGVDNRGTIGGDAVVVGGKLVNAATGRVAGEMRVVDGEPRQRRVAPEARMAAAAARMGILRGRHHSFAPLWRGVSGLASTLSLGLLLAGLGAALVFYAYPRLEAVSDSVRRDPARSAGLGIATGVLVLPAFIVMIVVLCITLIGIPLLAVAIPAFMLLAAAAAAMGLLAASHAIGERTAALHGSLEAHRRNGYTYVFTGLGLLLAPMAAAHLLQMTGFLAFLGDVLAFFSGLLLWVAAAVGAGAVIMTRAGGWWKWPRRAAYDPILDGDPFGPDTAGSAHA